MNLFPRKLEKMSNMCPDSCLLVSLFPGPCPILPPASMETCSVVFYVILLTNSQTDKQHRSWLVEVKREITRSNTRETSGGVASSRQNQTHECRSSPLSDWLSDRVSSELEYGDEEYEEEEYGDEEYEEEE